MIKRYEPYQHGGWFEAKDYGEWVKYDDHLAECEKLSALLADAVGLLHNHEQAEDEDWLTDYADVCERYGALLAKAKGMGRIT